MIWRDSSEQWLEDTASIPTQDLNLGTLDEPLDQQGLEARSKVLWLLKNAFFKETKCILQEAKTVRTGTKFLIRDITQRMGEHTRNQFAYPAQKQSRDTHPDRKGMDILSEEEECSKSEARERHTPREECWCPG